MGRLARAFPWWDLRLWAAALLGGGLGAAAGVGWRVLAPAHAVSTGGLALAGAAVAAAVVAVALHPRAARWTAEGNVLTAGVAVLAAAAVAPPIYGTRILAFLFAACALLFVWSRGAALARSVVRLCVDLPDREAGDDRRSAARLDRWRSAKESLVQRPLGERAAAATLDGLLLAGLWLALCDAAAGPGGGLVGGWSVHVLAAAAACAAALCLAAWAGRADVLRRARAEQANIQPGFGGLWWFAVVPAVALCVAVGAAVPTYRAPLQGHAVSGLVLGVVGPLTQGGAGAFVPPPATAAQMHAQDVTGLVLAAVCLVLLIAAWPGRRLLLRAVGASGEAGPAERIPWAERWRRFWALFFRGRRRRGAVEHHRSWPLRPVAPPMPPRREPAVLRRHYAAIEDVRGRVRVAYGNVLEQAGSAGLARPAGHSPRSFLDWIVSRATPVRFALESLTGNYEEARFSTHPLPAERAVRAEDDARAVAYGLAVTREEARRRAQAESSTGGLKWTPSRGLRGRPRD